MKFLSQSLTWFKNLFSQSRDTTIVLWKEIKSSQSVTSDKVHTTPSFWTLSSGQMTMFWVIWVIVIYAWYLAFQSLDLLYLILAAVLISVAMESLIVVGEKWMPRGISIWLSYLLLIVFVLTGIVIILPFVLQQLSSIITIVIQYFYTMWQQINALWLVWYIDSLTWMPNVIQDYILNVLRNDTMNIQSTLMNNISTLVSTGTDYAKNLWWIALSFVWWLFSILGQIGLVFTIAVLFSLEKESIVRFFVKHLSQDTLQTSYMSHKIDLFYHKMGLWLKAQLWLCVYIAIVVYVALLILSLFGFALPNMWALALMAGFTEFIPYIWPIIWAIPAVIVATSMYGLQGLVVVSIAYFVVQWIENNILIPLLMNKSLGVSPLLIFLCVLIGWSVLWFIGILLAVPLSVLITMVVKKDFE
jgi:predicted PurR-regulated permease PerM